MDAIVQHVQDHLVLYVVSATVALPCVYLTRKYTLPFVYHVFEYAFYCLIVHYVFGGIMRLAFWYHSETAFKNYDGTHETTLVPFTTPLSFDFWQKGLYSPEWLIYIEIVLALALLYLVVVVRPTRFGKNRYRGRKPISKKKSTSKYNPVGYRSRNRTAAQRSLLRRIRSGR